MKINQAEWNKFEKYCVNELQYIRDNIFTDNWTITVNFHKEKESELGQEYSADAVTDYDYRRHHIKLYKKAFIDNYPNNKINLILLLLHEFCHHFITPITELVQIGNNNDYLDTLNERTTELLSRNFYNFLYNENGTHKFK